MVPSINNQFPVVGNGSRNAPASWTLPPCTTGSEAGWAVNMSTARENVNHNYSTPRTRGKEDHLESFHLLGDTAASRYDHHSINVIQPAKELSFLMSVDEL
jgi:hypothetical protein